MQSSPACQLGQVGGEDDAGRDLQEGLLDLPCLLLGDTLRHRHVAVAVVHDQQVDEVEDLSPDSLTVVAESSSLLEVLVDLLDEVDPGHRQVRVVANCLLGNLLEGLLRVEGVDDELIEQTGVRGGCAVLTSSAATTSTSLGDLSLAGTVGVLELGAGAPLNRHDIAFLLGACNLGIQITLPGL